MGRARVVAWLVFVLVSLWPLGCSEDNLKPLLDQGGEGGPLIHLPRAEGKWMLCSQGAGGSFSHQAVSTAHDLDLDTSNSVDEELFAPVGGIARVHREHLKKNFGMHVNIDQGDGSYVVLAHFKDVFVNDGEPVAEGQLIGFEGCTGLCTGDHVHVGRHIGDASQMAEYGTSVSAAYLVKSPLSGGGLDVLRGDDAVCEDPIGSYQSGLKTNLWHPNGTLLKAPGDPKVYRIDAGYLRHVADERIFRSYGYDFADVLTVSKDEIGCYPPGVPVEDEGQVQAQEDADGVLWLFVGPLIRADRYRMRVPPDFWLPILESWGVPGAQDAVLASMPHGDSRLRDWPERSGFATFRDGTLLREGDALYVTSDGTALCFIDNDTSRFMEYGHHKVVYVPSGTVHALFERVGDCVSGIGCLTRDHSVRCGGAPDLEWPPAEVESVVDEEMPEPPAPDLIPPVPEVSSPPPVQAPRTLTVHWAAPPGTTPSRIMLSGELQRSGSYAMWWHDLVSGQNVSSVTFTLPGVQSGDVFRFSVEFTDLSGGATWSCMGPYPSHPTRQGEARAYVDEVSVPVNLVGDPSGATTGCGLILRVP